MLETIRVETPGHTYAIHLAEGILLHRQPEEVASTLRAGDIMRALRASEKAPGAERIYTCGEKEHLAWLERKEHGAPVNTALGKQLLSIRNELGLHHYRFPFEAANG